MRIEDGNKSLRIDDLSDCGTVGLEIRNIERGTAERFCLEFDDMIIIREHLDKLIKQIQNK